RIASISRSSAQGSTTTPFPITESFPGRTTPEGSRLSRYSTLPMTSVWPALCPPWKRTTTSARSESQSTILPLPSSPHWARIPATFAMTPGSLSRSGSVHREDCRTLEAVAAIEAPCLSGGGIRGLEPRDGHPTLSPQTLCGCGVGAGGEIETPRRRLRRQRAQDGIRVKRETGRGLAFAIAGAITPAPPELTAHAPRIKGEADARV